MLSRVVTRLPSMSSTGRRQDSIGSPSTRTVQLPQPPCRQPSLVAVNPSWYRSTACRMVMGRTMTSTSRPPSSKVTIVDAMLATLSRGARRQLLESPADEEANHPAPVPVRGDAVRERLAPLRRGVGRGGDRLRIQTGPDEPPFGLPGPDGMRADGAQRDARVGDPAIAPFEAGRDGHDGRRVRVPAAKLQVGGRLAPDRHLDLDEELVGREPVAPQPGPDPG